MLRRPPTALSITKDDVDEMRQVTWTQEKERPTGRGEPPDGGEARPAPERAEGAARLRGPAPPS